MEELIKSTLPPSPPVQVMFSKMHPLSVDRVRLKEEDEGSNRFSEVKLVIVVFVQESVRDAFKLRNCLRLTEDELP